MARAMAGTGRNQRQTNAQAARAARGGVNPAGRKAVAAAPKQSLKQRTANLRASGRSAAGARKIANAGGGSV